MTQKKKKSKQAAMQAYGSSWMVNAGSHCDWLKAPGLEASLHLFLQSNVFYFFELAAADPRQICLD
jgi:hypothetical protein